MEQTLVAFLVVNVALTAGVAGSILYASGVPYPYISPYALTYSYTRPPVVLSHPISLNFEAALAGAALPSPVIVGSSLEDIAADRRESEEIPGNQSPPEPSTALGEPVPSIAPEPPLPEVESPFPAPPSTVPGPTALGEPAAPPLASDELKYYHLSHPVTYTIPTPLAWPSASQFHQQDGLGQYNYGYANEHSSKQEFKLLDGITRGAYNYIDAEGKLQTVSYVSDDEGFRVAATNLPQPVVPVDIPDSPEVAAAKAAHLQAQSEAVANVNRANAADAVAAAGGGGGGGGASESGDNAVSGCNETSGDSTYSK